MAILKPGIFWLLVFLSWILTSEQSSYPMRLVNSITNSTDEGRLEIYYNNIWGTVCDDNWNDVSAASYYNAAVACRSLGFGFLGSARAPYNPSPGVGRIWLADVQCTLGTEESIADCPHLSWDTNYCLHSEDVWLICRPVANQTRTVNSLTNATDEGRLEIFYSNTWGTVCDNNWSNGTSTGTNNAGVSCQSLGFGFQGYARAYPNPRPGVGTIWLDNVNCSGSERRIANCRHNAWGIHNCDHYQDVWLYCKTVHSSESSDQTAAIVCGVIFSIVGIVLLFIIYYYCKQHPESRQRFKAYFYDLISTIESAMGRVKAAVVPVIARFKEWFLAKFKSLKRMTGQVSPETSNIPENDNTAVNNNCTPRYWSTNGVLSTDLSIGLGGSRTFIILPSCCVFLEKRSEVMAVQELFQNSWKPDLVGFGNDAAKRLQMGRNVAVHGVWRIENEGLHRRYRNQLSGMRDAPGTAIVPRSVVALRQTELTTRSLGITALNSKLTPEINEYFLFHGTRRDRIATVIRQGLDSRVGASGFFGKGIYFAESSTKSDQYVDEKGARVTVGVSLYMLLCRVALGDIYVADQPMTELVRPPCNICNVNICGEHPTQYNSVLGYKNFNKQLLLFREFVIYDSSQCYPEYLIEYTRQL